MVDILANGEFGRDDGWKCPDCGAGTFLTDDQGRGLCGYNCENCDRAFQVQYEWDEEEGCEPDDYYVPPYDLDDYDLEEIS